MPFRPVLVLLLTLAGGALALPAGADLPAQAKTLILLGRVSDAEGWPIAGASILAGSRAQPVAISDADGRYSIAMFVGSYSGLVQAPYHDVFRASRKGWDFSASSGGQGVAIEARVIPGNDGVARIQARSNDKAVAQAVAEALARSGDAPAEVSLHFVGRRGPESKRPGIVLSEQSVIPIGSSDAPPEMGLPPFGRRPASADTSRATAIPRAPATGAGSDVAPNRAPARASASAPARPSNSGDTGRPSGPARAPEPRRKPWRLFPSSDELLEEHRAARAAERAAADETTNPRVPDDTTYRIRTPVTQRPVSATSTRSPARVDTVAVPRAASTPPPRSVASAPVRTPPPTWRDTRAVAPDPAPARDNRAAAPVPAPPAVRTPPPTVRDTRSVTPDPAPRTATPGAAASRGPGNAPAKSGSAPGTQTGRSSIAVSVAPPPTRAGANGSDTSSSAVRVWGGRTLPSDPAPARAGLGCECTVKGTIEVRRTPGLDERVRVLVQIAGLPAYRDTVELFEGSSRSFEIAGVPCGRRRIEIESFGRRRFALASALPLGEFECQNGRFRQIHVVLIPR